MNWNDNIEVLVTLHYIERDEMDIQAEKLELVRLIVETDNPSILASIKKLFINQSQEDFWNKLSGEEKTEILEGLKEVDAGETVNYEDFINKHK